MERTKEAVLIVGEDGAVVFANQSAAAVLGRPASELVGRPFTDAARDLRTLDDEPLTDSATLVDEVFRGGRPVGAIPYLSHHADGTIAIVSLKAQPVALDHGVQGVGIEIAEASQPLLAATGLSSPLSRPEWEAHARRLQGLAQMSGLFTSTTSSVQAFEQVVEYGRVLFDMDSCVALREEEGSGLFVVAAAAGFEEPPEPSLRSSDVHRLGLDRPVPVIIADLAAVAHLELFSRLRAAGYRSAIGLGLVTSEGSHGVVVFLHREPARLTEEDLVVLRLFGTMSAATLSTAERHETDAHLAQTVQQALLAVPHRLPGIEHATLYRSATKGAEVGGDFYDLFALPDGRMAFLIGDISGKGLSASILMGVLKDTVKAYTYINSDPAEIMQLCNTLLLDIAPPWIFATAFLALYDPIAEQLHYCGAGHPPPMLLRPDRSVVNLEPRSPVLGILKEARYTSDTADFASGDLLLLYTDGMTEARSEEGLLGEERLMRYLLESPSTDARAVLEHVFGAAQEYAGGQFSDDIALLVVRAKPRAED